MLQMIYNINSQNNASLNKDNNFFNNIFKEGLSISVLNQLNKYLLRKEIEFDNVFTEEKKNDDNDKNIVCANFIINNLLNILNKRDRILNSETFNNIKDNKMQKKKIKKNQVNSLHTIDFLKNIKDSKKNKIKNTFKILKIETESSKLINNKNQFNQINELNNIRITNNLDSKKTNNQLFQRKTNIPKVYKNKMKFIEDEKKVILPLDTKKNKKFIFFSKNINKIDNIIHRRNSFPIFNKKEHIKSYIKPLLSNNTKNSIEWKKLISHKILLSISNKNNQAEIHLKPESLGSIHIVINMKNNAATLKFISKYNEVRMFLENSIPFLRNSLTEHGIKLEKFNISSSLTNKKYKNYKNLFSKNINYLDSFKKNLNIYKNDLDLKNFKPIDIYI
ncbi:flagellar hook-length control protein FliK [Buchnera aphidicola (Acyrthosiphon lactucae)]|uniref:Flagellar hook-length control protein FliK n=1 Tax=Buchnera aphidicola (Acyrthosiphon lactucae) TaxID=1241832 RepID=A0A4D6XLL3_9GAMM|nr:flagellar hook-length control protein FliK [Buchnera aphidicola]QCI17493.1 flagellar hook-length control protein FliK [Buchnera aphidicola (Acyrthosiphon lactucae)]